MLHIWKTKGIHHFKQIRGRAAENLSTKREVVGHNMLVTESWKRRDIIKLRMWHQERGYCSINLFSWSTPAPPCQQPGGENAGGTLWETSSEELDTQE